MKQSTYKVIDLFGNEELRFFESNVKKTNLFTNHEAFVEKFETKKTTDDCYTPPDIFSLVLHYVREKCDISGAEIIRPFYPGGDFEVINYPDNCVVIDNPPFSIISKIARFYIDRSIRFFLFAPHLTLFCSDIDCTHIVVGGNVTYENGAIVKTSFLSNMFGQIKIIGDADLLSRFKELEKSKRVSLPKYDYPNNIVTVSHVAWMIERGISLQIDKGHTKHCRSLDAQKPHGKGIFGSGFLLSEKAAAEKAAAEKAAAEKAAAEKAAAEKENVIIWELSKREKGIIASLG
jgi:hypothetical protein